MKATMAIFGGVLGLMLAVVGFTMSQDLVLGAEAGVCVSNPIPFSDLMGMGKICPEAGAHVTISGVGWLIFMSLMLLIVIGMVAVGFLFFFIPSLRGGMPAFASFAIFLMVVFIAAFMVLVKFYEVFYG